MANYAQYLVLCQATGYRIVDVRSKAVQLSSATNPCMMDLTGVTVQTFQRVLSASVNLYGGDTVQDQVDALIRHATVVVFGRAWCPFTIDSIHLLTEALQVHTHIVHLDAIPDAKAIIDALQARLPGRKVVMPTIFVHGQLVGGCEELFRLNHSRYHSKRLTSSQALRKLGFLNNRFLTSSNLPLRLARKKSFCDILIF